MAIPRNPSTVGMYGKTPWGENAPESWLVCCECCIFISSCDFRVYIPIVRSDTTVRAPKKRRGIRLHPADGNPPSGSVPDDLFAADHKPFAGLAGSEAATWLALQENAQPGFAAYV